VTSYDIVSEETRFEMGTRPGIPGLSVRISGVQGSFEATITDGAVDLAQPAGGAFELLVDELRAGNAFVTAGVRQWLGRQDGTVVRGEVTEVRARDDRRYDVLMRIDILKRTVPLKGVGRVSVRPTGLVEVAGTTICDPRSFGVPLPPLLNLMVHVRWRLVLSASAATDP
jgi:hypothetical protein